MKNREYIFTNKRYTTGGIISTGFGIVGGVCLILGILLAFHERGNGGSTVGLIGTAAFLCSAAGLFFGIRSFQKEEGFYTFSWIGSVINGIVFMGMVAIIMIGVLL